VTDWDSIRVWGRREGGRTAPCAAGFVPPDTPASVFDAARTLARDAFRAAGVGRRRCIAGYIGAVILTRFQNQKHPHMGRRVTNLHFHLQSPNKR